MSPNDKPPHGAPPSGEVDLVILESTPATVNFRLTPTNPTRKDYVGGAQNEVSLFVENVPVRRFFNFRFIAEVLGPDNIYIEISFDVETYRMKPWSARGWKVSLVENRTDILIKLDTSGYAIPPGERLTTVHAVMNRLLIPDIDFFNRMTDITIEISGDQFHPVT